MFTREIPCNRTPRSATLKSIGAAVGAITLAGGILCAAGATADNHGAATYAEGQFLSGLIGGSDLDAVIAFQSAEAENNGHQSTQETTDPLAVTVLGEATIGPDTNTHVDPDDSVHAGNSTSGGAVSQYARAQANGTAVGASGTVGEGGAIGPDATQDGQRGPLVISLDGAIDDRFAAALGELRLQIEVISAQAKGNPSRISGDYFVDGVTLRFTSPVVGDLNGQIGSALVPVDATLKNLSGDDGLLAKRVDALLTRINAGLSLTGSSAEVSASVRADLQAAVAPALRDTYGARGVTVNLATGEVVLDLEALAGGDLNDKPVGYEVLNDALVARALDGIDSVMTDVADTVKARVESALRSARVDIDASVVFNDPPLLRRVCVNADGDAGLLGGATGGSAGVRVCVKSAFSPQTRASVAVHGTVEQVLDGDAPASVRAQVLDRTASISTGQVLDSLDTSLVDTLFDNDGALNRFTDKVNSDVITPLAEGPFGHDLDSLLSDALSVKVNVQEAGTADSAVGTQFTQTAMRVAVAPAAEATGPTAVNLAAATVAGRLLSDAALPPGAGGGSGGGLDLPTFALGGGATGALASTGIGIAILVAAVLALLAAGGYLARKHRTQDPGHAAKA